MTTPYPKPRWDLENDVLRLEQMIILYEQEIAELRTEKEQLKEEVTLLRRRLEYYKTIVEVDEEENFEEENQNPQKQDVLYAGTRKRDS